MKVLATWIKDNKTTAAALGRSVGLTRSAICKMLSGDRLPSPTVAQNLSEVTGIPMTKLRPDLAKMFQGGA
jgi:transcriptional regulator with XRE-family HTH domain